MESKILKDTDRNTLNFDAFDPDFHRPFENVTGDVYWNQHIRGLFTWNNAQCMTKYLNLTNFDSVNDNADKIYTMVSQGKMPPGDPWPQDQIDLFGKWVNKLVNKKRLEGNPVDTGKPDSLIMDPPLRYKFDPPPKIATYNDHISPLITFCDRDIAAKVYNDIDVKQYEQFKKAANDYKEGETDKNIVYDIFNDKFPQGNRWPPIWKTVLTNWIDNGFQQGELTIYEDPA